MNNTDIIKNSLKNRYKRERNFKFFGFCAVFISFLFLFILLLDVFIKGYSAFWQTYIKLDINLAADTLQVDANSTQEEFIKGKYAKVINQAIYEKFPEVKNRREKRNLRQLVSNSAQYDLREKIMADPSLIDTNQSFWLVAKDDIDVFIKGGIDRNLPESDRRLKDYQIAWVDQLMAEGAIEKKFNTIFFSSGDSRDPEQAGIMGALMGSLLTLSITFLLSFPIGVAAATYLEEFAPQQNRWVDLIEININNLAAVPSIVYGLLGLAVFINFFDVPRSTPIVGGLVLTLMTFPTIIITARAAIKSVPPSLRQAALGLGASRMQTTLHHVLPAAMPGVLTGSIIGMARALGESAPLLMIGMIAFIVDIPNSFDDPASVLPVQIFLWADSPERAFTERTSAAIIVLLVFMICMNLLAIILRKKFEKKW